MIRKENMYGLKGIEVALDRCVTDFKALNTELATIYKRGYSPNGEFWADMRSIITELHQLAEEIEDRVNLEEEI